MYLLLHQLWELDPKTALSVGWRRVLKVEDAQESVVLKRMASVYRLPAQIQKEAALLTTLDPAPILNAIPQVEQVIKAWTTGNKIDWFHTTLGPGNLTALEMGSSALSRLRPQPTVADERLSSISDAINELADEIGASDLSDAARGQLQSIIDDLREAVEEHDLNGTPPLRDAAQRAVGLLVTEVKVRDELGDSSIARRLGGILYTILIILNLAAGPLSLPASVEYWAENVIEVVEDVEDEGPQTEHQNDHPTIDPVTDEE